MEVTESLGNSTSSLTSSGNCEFDIHIRGEVFEHHISTLGPSASWSFQYLCSYLISFRNYILKDSHYFGGREDNAKNATLHKVKPNQLRPAIFKNTKVKNNHTVGENVYTNGKESIEYQVNYDGGGGRSVEESRNLLYINLQDWVDFNFLFNNHLSSFVTPPSSKVTPSLPSSLLQSSDIHAYWTLVIGIARAFLMSDSVISPIFPKLYYPSPFILKKDVEASGIYVRISASLNECSSKQEIFSKVINATKNLDMNQNSEGTRTSTDTSASLVAISSSSTSSKRLYSHRVAPSLPGKTEETASAGEKNNDSGGNRWSINNDVIDIRIVILLMLLQQSRKVTPISVKKEQRRGATDDHWPYQQLNHDSNPAESPRLNSSSTTFFSSSTLWKAQAEVHRSVQFLSRHMKTILETVFCHDLTIEEFDPNRETLRKLDNFFVSDHDLCVMELLFSARKKNTNYDINMNISSSVNMDEEKLFKKQNFWFKCCKMNRVNLNDAYTGKKRLRNNVSGFHLSDLSSWLKNICSQDDRLLHLLNTSVHCNSTAIPATETTSLYGPSCSSVQATNPSVSSNVSSNNFFFSESIVISNLQQKVILIDDCYLTFCSQNLIVANCTECDIFVTIPISSIRIVKSKESSFVCSCVSGHLSVCDCERVQIHAATYGISVENTLDPMLFVYTCRPPSLCGDTRGVLLAPFNCVVSKNHLRTIHEAFEDCLLTSAFICSAFAYPICCCGKGVQSKLQPMHQQKEYATPSSAVSHVYNLLNPKDFSLITLPPWASELGESHFFSNSKVESSGPEYEKAGQIPCERKYYDEYEVTTRKEVELQDSTSILSLPEDYFDVISHQQKDASTLLDMLENMDIEDKQRDMLHQLLSFMLYEYSCRHSHRSRRILQHVAASTSKFAD